MRSGSLRPSAISCGRYTPSPSLAIKTPPVDGAFVSVGAAVDLVESGYTIEQVMRKGDWKSVQAGLRYVMAE